MAAPRSVPVRPAAPVVPSARVGAASRRAGRVALAGCTAALLLAAALPAQRETPALEHQKRTTELAYGAAVVGKHTLAELPVGGNWRFGMNEASTWSLQMPILFGDVAAPPGEYRVKLLRVDEQRCALLLEGSGQALGNGKDLQLEGALAEAGKPSKKLQVEWVRGAAKGPHLGAELVAQFGPHQWKAAMTLVGGAATKVGGWQLTTFALPAAAVAARDTTPAVVATLSRGADKDVERWNLVLAGGTARLVPWMEAPTDSFGFGKVEPPAADATTQGTVEVAPQAGSKATEVVELRSSALKKREFALQLAAGKDVLLVAVPEPKGRAQ